MSKAKDKLRKNLKRISNESLKTQMINIDDILLDVVVQGLTKMVKGEKK